jgi:hypothetical protein
MTIEWKTEYDDLMDRSPVILKDFNADLDEANIVALRQLVVVVRPLVVVDAVVRAGYHPYEGTGHKLARLLLFSLDAGLIKPPLRVETVWEFASTLSPRPLPDWAPYEGDPL